MSYLYHQGAPAAIHSLIPDVRLIAILRHPVDRAFSDYVQTRRLGREPLATFEAAIAAEDERVRAGWGNIWHYGRKGRYAEQLERYLAIFPREQRLVVLYDDLVRDPRGVMRSLYHFLGVRVDVEPEVAVARNVSGVPRGRIAQTLLPITLMLGRYSTPYVPTGLKQWVRQRLMGAKPVLAPTTRQHLLEGYLDDIHALEQLLGWDLTHWLEPVVSHTTAGYPEARR